MVLEILVKCKIGDHRDDDKSGCQGFHAVFPSLSSVCTHGERRRLRPSGIFLLCNQRRASRVKRKGMDEDLNQWLAGGDRQRAFEALVQRYRTKVFRLVFSIVGNTARAEEVTQDTFLKIWLAL